MKSLSCERKILLDYGFDSNVAGFYYWIDGVNIYINLKEQINMQEIYEKIANLYHLKKNTVISQMLLAKKTTNDIIKDNYKDNIKLVKFLSRKVLFEKEKRKCEELDYEKLFNVG
jgi:intein/homing endonuclease